MIEHDSIYVDGAWIPSSGSGTIDVVNPATEAVIGRVPEGTADDVDRAVAAARRAFDGDWGRTTPADRVKFLQQLNEQLVPKMGDIAELVTAELGMPSHLAQMIQVGLPLGMLSNYLEIAESYEWETDLHGSIIRREPIGVVGAITPWNFPLHQITCKLYPALLAGCTMVLKPSEFTPLTAYALTDILHEIGLPPGVFNLVIGDGPTVGEAIAAHPDIDMVSFTGSTRAGTRVAELASATVKRVAQELGGKSPFIVLDDADLTEAVPAGISACYINEGQACSAWTRMLVPEDKVDEAAAIAKGVAENFVVGDPTQPGTHFGPLVNARQWERVQGLIEQGIEEGATLVTGGPGKPEGLDTGYYVKPTVFSHVTNDMTIAREEIFGPVLSIIGYKDDDDAVRIANDTSYGLHGGVYSGDPERAKGIARRMRAGQIDINGQKPNLYAPFGGYKQSGNGREWGPYGLEEYLEIKAING